MRTLFITATIIFGLSTSQAGGQSLLHNGDFEITTSTVLPDGTLRFDGWTQRLTNSGQSGIGLESTNELSVFDITADRFDGPTSAAPDPYFPYQSPSDPRLDHFAYTRPSAPAPVTSFGELYSDEFVIDGTISIDVWRESANAVSTVSFWRAADNRLLNSFTVTSASQQWSRVRFDTTALVGEHAYIVLHGGTQQVGLGWLTLFDNVTGGVSVSVVPEPGAATLLVGFAVPSAALLLRRRRAR